jgi:MFS family permease
MTHPSKSPVRRLAIARLISLTGGAAAYIALTFTIYERTRSAAWLSATLLLTFGATGFVSPLAGFLGDRFDRRRVMICSDLAGAACFAAMALVHAPVLLLSFAFLSTIAEAPFLSASAAAIPNMVDERDLSWANSLVSMARYAGITVGPLLGGVLLHSLGSPAVFAANAATFVASAALVFTVRARFSRPSREDSDEHRGLRAGFRFLLRDGVLRRITFAWIVMVLGLAMAMVADTPLSISFGQGSRGLGLIVACWGAGSVAGAYLGRFLNARTERYALVFGTAAIALTSLGAGLSPIFWPILAFVLGQGVGDSFSLVGEQGIRQRRTPDSVRSRVMAASEAAWQLAMAVSFVLAGFVLEAVGPQGVYVVAGVAAGLATIVLLPVLRDESARAPAPVRPDASPPGSSEPRGFDRVVEPAIKREDAR